MDLTSCSASSSWLADIVGFPGMGDTGGEFAGDTTGGLLVPSLETSRPVHIEVLGSASIPSEDVIVSRLLPGIGTSSLLSRYPCRAIELIQRCNTAELKNEADYLVKAPLDTKTNKRFHLVLAGWWMI